MGNFSKYLLFINFGGKFHPKICCSSYLLRYDVVPTICRKQDGTKFAHNILNEKVLKT